MKKKMLAFVVVGLLVSLAAAAQTVDEIIAKNIEAQGGLAKLRAIQSVRMTGRIGMGQGMEVPVVIEVKRPGSMRMEITFQGMTGISAYDGKVGWQLMPFGGKKDPEPMTAEQLKDVEDQADMDGPLVDYKTKGNKVEYLGKESVEGADCYKLKLTKKNGDVVNMFIDSDTNLLIKSTGKRMMRGTEVEFENSVGDYKEVEGVLFPHVTEGGVVGNPMRQKIMFDKIEINVPIDDARFKMPEVPKAPEAPKPPEVKPPQK